MGFPEVFPREIHPLGECLTFPSDIMFLVCGGGWLVVYIKHGYHGIYNITIV